MVGGRPGGLMGCPVLIVYRGLVSGRNKIRKEPNGLIYVILAGIVEVFWVIGLRHSTTAGHYWHCYYDYL